MLHSKALVIYKMVDYCIDYILDVPPQLQNRGKPVPGGAGMRPPPGARGAAAAQDTGGSGGGGILTMVLPMYAGGIFLYLLYAASKVGLF